MGVDAGIVARRVSPAAHPLIIDTPFAAIWQGDAAPSALPLKLSMLGKTQTITGQISQ